MVGAVEGDAGLAPQQAQHFELLLEAGGARVEVLAERVVLGSDYPFDMGAPDCVHRVRELAIAEVEKTTILSGAAMQLLWPAR